MLSEICKELKNWFLINDNCKHFGEFEISDDTISPSDFIKENQYFRIIGSVFNDGIYKNNSEIELTDETFNGAIWTMAIPKELIELDTEITAWVEKYADIVNSPFTSESFGGYTYSKVNSSIGNNNSSNNTSWQSVFSSKLNKWRKI